MFVVNTSTSAHVVQSACRLDPAPLSGDNFGGYFEEERRFPCLKDTGTHANGAPIVKVSVLEHIMDDISNRFSAKNATRLQDFAYIQLYILTVYPEVMSPDPRRSAPGALTQTSVSAWFAAFPLFMVYETTTGVWNFTAVCSQEWIGLILKQSRFRAMTASVYACRCLGRPHQFDLGIGVDSRLHIVGIQIGIQIVVPRSTQPSTLRGTVNEYQPHG